MSLQVKEIEYYYTIVADTPGELRKLLEYLSKKEVDLMALTAFPVGDNESQIDFVPIDPGKLRAAASEVKIPLVGPKKAFLVQGDGKIDELYEFHLKLSNVGINIHACNGVIDSTGRFGYVVWVNPGDYDVASGVLKAADWSTSQTSPSSLLKIPSSGAVLSSVLLRCT